MKVIETLIQIYPAPDAILNRMALVRGLDLDAVATAEILTSNSYKLTDADVQMWLSTSPDISQSGISFTLNADKCKSLKEQANKVYKDLKDPAFSGTTYGYKGSKL